MADVLEPVTVGIDGSPAAGRAVEWAADEAARWRRPLRIVFALDTWPFDGETGPPRMRAEAAELGRSELRDAEAVARTRQPDVPVTAAVLQGAPVPALRLESERAFTLVVGNRGSGGFTGMPIGSTALLLAGRTAGPLVIVRHVRGGAPAGGHDEVVAGTDLSDGSIAALRYAAEAAALRGARLRVVHARPVPGLPARFVSALDLARTRERARDRLREACGPVREWHPDLTVVESVVSGHPVSTLADASGEADLVVIGSRGRGAMASAVLGSVGHGVIRHAGCPVAVIGAEG